MRIRCPSCKKRNFFFDSPSMLGIYLFYRDGDIFFYDVERGRKLRRSQERCIAIESELLSEDWWWTCEYCVEGIEPGMKQWKQLNKKALEFLKQ